MKHYKQTEKKIWTGRVDGFEKDRFHSRVINSHFEDCFKVNSPLALLGFCSDEGVRRNKGRQGAFDGPKRIREELRNLAVHFDESLTLLDIGDVFCNDKDLESSQETLSGLVSYLRSLGKISFVLGGGHETAWGHFCGLKKDLESSSLGIINFDAHFDLRSCEKGYGSSGTPFYQVAEFCKKEGEDFNYAVIGIQDFSNTKYLFNKAKSYGTKIIKADDFRSEKKEKIKENLKAFIMGVDKIYLSLCLDIFSSSNAPGVSAANPFGLDPRDILPLLEEIILSGKVIALDIVELSPKHDEDRRTAKLAAYLVNFMVQKLSDIIKK